MEVRIAQLGQGDSSKEECASDTCNVPSKMSQNTRLKDKLILMQNTLEFLQLSHTLHFPRSYDAGPSTSRPCQRKF